MARDIPHAWNARADLRLREYLGRAGYKIPRGLGTENDACSLAAINLALSGILSDSVPSCMSKALGNWLVQVQDVMPDQLRNSRGWKDLLPDAAACGEALYVKHSALIVGWAWRLISRIEPVARKCRVRAAFADFMAQDSRNACQDLIEAIDRELSNRTAGAADLDELNDAHGYALRRIQSIAESVKDATYTEKPYYMTNAALKAIDLDTDPRRPLLAGMYYQTEIKRDATVEADLFYWERIVNPVGMLRLLVSVDKGMRNG